MLAVERHEFILSRLKETGRVHVAELSETLKVSRMTIHRDLDALVQEGIIEKVFGGAILRVQVSPKNQTGTCAVCARPTSVHTRVVLHLQDGGQLEACCPHCALLLLESRDDVVSGLAVDFIHGKMINLKTASFVVNPAVVVCCTPSVLCFADADEAARFQTGFHGEVASLREAQALTIQHMNLSL